MQGDKPVGGRWNFDSENRKPAEPDLLRPKHIQLPPDAITMEIVDLVGKLFSDNFGKLENFGFAVTRSDAIKVLDGFMSDFLPNFGETQDAMLQYDPGSTIRCCRFTSTSDSSMESKSAARLSGRIERERTAERCRGLHSPNYRLAGIYAWHLLACGPRLCRKQLHRQHPCAARLYWSGETEMNCLSKVITETIKHAYAHHIQRLMITDNFALLAGIDPKQIHHWYLEVYADAYEWVELPNVI